MEKESISKAINEYYTEKILKFGKCPQGVDWKDEQSQRLRYEKIVELFKCDSNFTVADYGCGYGFFSQYLKEKGISGSYSGYDISAEMIKAANAFSDPNITFINSEKLEEKYDYIVASGIFNVKFSFDDHEWSKMVLEKIDYFNAYSNKGFAFNCLSTYSDIEKRRADLFYADPLFIFDLCKKKFSKNVALLHDYDLYEFTIIVRKNSKGRVYL